MAKRIANGMAIAMWGCHVREMAHSTPLQTTNHGHRFFASHRYLGAPRPLGSHRPTTRPPMQKSDDMGVMWR